MAQITDYRKVAAAKARKYGLGGWFVNQIGAESNFNPGAHSSADARGIAQIVPRWHPDVDPNTPGNQPPGVNPALDLEYAAKLDRGLLNKYGSVARALSAYNSGRPDAYKDPRFAKGQTYDYVRKILGGTGSGAFRGSSGQMAATPAPMSNPGASPPPAPSQDSRRSLLLALANVAPGPQGNFTPFLNQLRQSRTSPSPETTPGPVPSMMAPAPAPPTRRGGSLAELLHEGVGGPTHSTGEHVHVASTDPQVMLALIREAQRRHLATLENPYVDPVAAGVHAPHSFHKRTFPGKYNGRQLGEALDVSGPGMNDYEAWVRTRYGRR